MPRLRVAYDTNVYRGIGQQDFATIRRLERNHSITGAASYWVVAELLAHLVDASDPSFSAAGAGLRRLVEHCRYYNGSQYCLRMIADVDAQVAYGLFGWRLPDARESGFFAGLAGAVYEGGPAALVEHRSTLIELREAIASDEVRFRENIWKNIVLKLIPSADAWTDLAGNREKQRVGVEEINSLEAAEITARHILSKIAERGRRTLETEEYEARTAEILQVLGPAIRLHNNMFSHIIDAGIDLRKPKHSNLFWDIHIAFTAAAFTCLGITPLWLITSDRVILNAARDAQMGWAVRTLEDYRAAIANPSFHVRPPGIGVGA